MKAIVEIEIDYEIGGTPPDNFNMEEIILPHFINQAGIITSETIDGTDNYAILIDEITLKNFRTV